MTRSNTTEFQSFGNPGVTSNDHETEHASSFFGYKLYGFPILGGK